MNDNEYTESNAEFHYLNHFKQISFNMQMGKEEL